MCFSYFAQKRTCLHNSVSQPFVTAVTLTCQQFQKYKTKSSLTD